MIWLVYTTQAAALADVSLINIAMSYPNSTIKTMTWAMPIQRLDGNWCFLAPAPEYLSGLTGQQETYDRSWFPEPTLP